MGSFRSSFEKGSVWERPQDGKPRAGVGTEVKTARRERGVQRLWCRREGARGKPPLYSPEAKPPPKKAGEACCTAGLSEDGMIKMESPERRQRRRYTANG